MAHDAEKEAAGRESAKFVRDGDVVGLGTGSTAAYAVRFLAERVQAGLKIVGVPTSDRTRELALSLGLTLATLDDYQQLDITIDGADEVDSQLRLIKGGGGALLREKIVASASKKMVIIVDSTKYVAQLGQFPLPVEVVPFAQAIVEKKIRAMNIPVVLRVNADGGPYLTDEHNHILDCHFGAIADPDGLARSLSDMPGVVEHGLFIGFATTVLVGRGSSVEALHRG